MIEYQEAKSALGRCSTEALKKRDLEKAKLTALKGAFSTRNNDDFSNTCLCVF
jgi:hypothetical protein